MNFEKNYSRLKFYLTQYGWELTGKDELFEYYRNNLHVELKFPQKKNDSDYPKMFEIGLKNLKRVTPEISKLPVFGLLISQCKNMRQKYSKSKSEWILSEPNSKYKVGEIPDVYIPKNYIFENRN